MRTISDKIYRKATEKMAAAEERKEAEERLCEMERQRLKNGAKAQEEANKDNMVYKNIEEPVDDSTPARKKIRKKMETFLG